LDVKRLPASLLGLAKGGEARRAKLRVKIPSLVMHEDEAERSDGSPPLLSTRVNKIRVKSAPCLGDGSVKVVRKTSCLVGLTADG